MARTLLTLMSIAAQVLSGCWGNAALCLRSDGTLCCVHNLASECSCCEHEHEHDAPHSDADCSGPGKSICQIAGNHNHDDDHGQQAATEPQVPSESPLLPCHPCGCRHIPLSPGSAPTSHRSTTVTSSDGMQDHRQTCECAQRRWMHSNIAVTNVSQIWSPRCMTVGLTIIVSTVIRC